jgi:death on curing protein
MSDAPNSNKPIFKHRGHRYLTVRSIVHLHDEIIAFSGGLPGVKDAGLLESAIRKVTEAAFGDDLYSTLFTKAAAVGFSIAQNHVFNDANKRTALSVMVRTLELNGYKFKLEQQAATTVMVLIATGNLGIPGVRVALLHWAGLNPGDDTL